MLFQILSLWGLFVNENPVTYLDSKVLVRVCYRLIFFEMSLWNTRASGECVSQRHREKDQPVTHENQYLTDFLSLLLTNRGEVSSQSHHVGSHAARATLLVDHYLRLRGNSSHTTATKITCVCNQHPLFLNATLFRGWKRMETFLFDADAADCRT